LDHEDRKNDQKKSVGSTYTGFGAKASISGYLREHATPGTINLLTGDHWKNFRRHFFDPLQSYNTD